MNAQGWFVVLVTTANAEEAQKIAGALVSERLAACCNIVGNVRSIYRWEEKICDEGEVLIVIKTRQANFEKLERRVKALHSYKVPEIIALPVEAGSSEYLKWLGDNS